MNIDTLKIPFSKLTKLELSGNCIVLYGVILFHAYQNETTWITNKLLAKECNIAERTVQNCLKELQDKGAIEIRYEQENGFSVRYIKPLILFDVKVVPNNYKNNYTTGGFETL